MPRVVQSDAARRDLAEIWDYIASDDFDAADQWLDVMKQKLELLAEFPGMGRERTYPGRIFRSFPVGRYVIFYQPFHGGITVARVLHGARDFRKIFGDEV
jgi:toxin ParE1/3/4